MAEGSGGGGLRSSLYGSDVSMGLRKLNAELRAHRKQVTLAMLAVLQRQIIEELSTPGRGRVRWNRVKLTRAGRVTAKAIHKAGRASAPGDPPAPDYGKLRGSIQIEYDEPTQRGRVGTNTKYAAALNFGTRRAGRSRKVVILPRPFMEPALKKSGVAMTAAGVTQFRLAVRGRLT